MMEFFEGMNQLEQTYWGIALISSAVLVIIFILTFIGGDVDSDMSADGSDFSADDGGVGFQFFTFKNVVAFFTIFGWTGIVCISNEYSTLTTIIISALAGLLMMVLTTLMFFWMARLAQSGTLKIQKAVGAIGEVYLPIGAKRSSIGKVSIKVQGSLRELEAITDHETDLPTSSLVNVLEIVSAELLLVEPSSK